MTGGLIQLVSSGIEDIVLTKDPEITLFNIVYRRHTNFSTESIPQYFKTELDFGKKASCILSKIGDLINQIYLTITLPAIIKGNNKYAWIRRIGFAIIKNYEIIINGELIDRQYGEWLNVWYELIGPKDNGFNNMIGDIPELTNLSDEKDEYTLNIPLQFWFCRNTGSALPLVCLQYSEVKINVELNDIEQCLLVTPTHYINIVNDFVNFKQFEYIEQNIDGRIASGIFIDYDFINKRLYYMKISKNQFQSYNDELYGMQSMKYLIKGIESNSFVMIEPNTIPYLYNIDKPKISLVKCFLLIDYIYLDNDERKRFLEAKHDYLIEQVVKFNDETIESTNALINIDIGHPCKFLVWMIKLNYLYDMFNYTDNYLNGKSLIRKETLLIAGKERISFRDYNYFNYVQPYQYFKFGPLEGINVYSFSLLPDKLQPAGSCNMGIFDNIQIKLNLNPIISINNPATFKGYATTYNILRIINGLAGIVFTNKEITKSLD